MALCSITKTQHSVFTVEIILLFFCSRWKLIDWVKVKSGHQLIILFTAQYLINGTIIMGSIMQMIMDQGREIDCGRLSEERDQRDTGRQVKSAEGRREN